jgi:imidazolonepropionase-like amidohydrolase
MHLSAPVKWPLALLLLMLCASLPAHAGSGTILLKNATIHTVNGGIIQKGCVLVEHGRIALVAEVINMPVDEVVDLSGKHLYPGMIAPTTTLGLLEINAVRSTRDTTEVGQWTPEILSWRAVNPGSELIPVARANGITHAQPIPLGGTVSGQSSLIQLHGWTVEDLMVRPSVGLHLFWPSMSINHRPKAWSQKPSEWKTPMEQAKQRRLRIRRISTFYDDAKAYVAHHASSETPVEIPNWAATRAWVNGEIPLFIHANEKRQIESAVTWTRERKLRMILVGGRDAWMLAELLAMHEIPVIYEHTFTLPQRGTDPYDVHFAAPSILSKAGVRVIFSEGSDRFAASSVRNLPYAAAQAVAFGLPEEEALKGLTLYTAEILGLGSQLGSIETGKEASLIALNGELLDIRAQVTHVWIQGQSISIESRHTRLYRKYRDRPRITTPD